MTIAIKQLTSEGKRSCPIRVYGHGEAALATEYVKKFTYRNYGSHMVIGVNAFANAIKEV